MSNGHAHFFVYLSLGGMDAWSDYLPSLFICGGTVSGLCTNFGILEFLLVLISHYTASLVTSLSRFLYTSDKWGTMALTDTRFLYFVLNTIFKVNGPNLGGNMIHLWKSNYRIFCFQLQQLIGSRQRAYRILDFAARRR